MRQLTAEGKQAINDLAQRHGVSVDAVMVMLQALINGNGTMAQFNHPEFGGSGQWLQGGMTMVGDMFNYQLQGTVNGICSELSGLLANEPLQVTPTSSRSQRQGVQQQQQGGGQQQQSSQSSPQAAQQPQGAPAGGFDDFDDDIPF